MELDIRPKVGMYAAFARLNYKPWYAMAEFIDNSIQAFLSARDELPGEGLFVSIEIADNFIRISDNSTGIAKTDLARAFSPSERPNDPSGLSEFGIGMKAAACWFAQKWTVRTKHYKSLDEYTMVLDVPLIVATQQEKLAPTIRTVNSEGGYTEILLENLQQPCRGRTIGKIKSHLASIYRRILREYPVRIEVVSGGRPEELSHEPPEFLVAPLYTNPEGEAVEWRRDFSFNLQGNKEIHGWAGLLKKGSATSAGFSVFRRGRLIQGTADEAYKPIEIFRNPNSFTYQRLVGEIDVVGFDVSHTKDGIQWGGDEEEVVRTIKSKLSAPDCRMLAQAEGYRVRTPVSQLSSAFGVEAVQGTEAELSHFAKKAITEAVSSENEDIKKRIAEASPAPESVEKSSGDREEIDPFTLGGTTFRIDLLDDHREDWYSYRNGELPGEKSIRINLGHPFSEAFVNGDENTMGPIARVVAALVLAEITISGAGVPGAEDMRILVNKNLRDFFS